MLDNDADALGLDARFLGFDMTHILDNAEVRTPMMMYLFHRIAALVDGRRLVIDIDEFWKALGDEAFRGLAQDGLKTYRKQNAFMVFGTQSPADALRSPIAHTILEQCATKIFLPNPHAAERDYIEGFGLTRREFALVREELTPESRRFLVKQGHDSRGRRAGPRRARRPAGGALGPNRDRRPARPLRAEVGDDSAAWRGPFHDARRRLR